MGRVRKSRKIPFVAPDELLAWLRSHPERWDSRKVELYALGPETDWIMEKRERDATQGDRYRHGKYDDIEDAIIRAGYRSGISAKVTAERLGRSYWSVQSRIRKLDMWGAGTLRDRCRRQKEG